MRLHIQTTPNTELVPFNHLHKLVGTIHKWLGHNDLHHQISLYSFSWLRNGRPNSENTGLNFRNGATFFISFYKSEPIKQIIQSILMNNPELFCGMSVKSIDIEETPDLSERSVFCWASPIFIKRDLSNPPNGKYKHYTFQDNESEALLEETLRSKLKEAGLTDDETLHIQFDKSDPRKFTKVVHYRNIGNKASCCRVIIEGKPETKQFIWDVGLGNSTGIGFGAIE